jgi:hypothetical protein
LTAAKATRGADSKEKDDEAIAELEKLLLAAWRKCYKLGAKLATAQAKNVALAGVVAAKDADLAALASRAGALERALAAATASGSRHAAAAAALARRATADYDEAARLIDAQVCATGAAKAACAQLEAALKALAADRAADAGEHAQRLADVGEYFAATHDAYVHTELQLATCLAAAGSPYSPAELAQIEAQAKARLAFIATLAK